jgi:hypothetical protein
MFNKIRKLWKQRKIISQVIKHIRENQAWIDIILKAIRFAKGGYFRTEIVELACDVLKIFKLRVEVHYFDDKAVITFYMKG